MAKCKERKQLLDQICNRDADAMKRTCVVYSPPPPSLFFTLSFFRVDLTHNGLLSIDIVDMIHVIPHIYQICESCLLYTAVFFSVSLERCWLFSILCAGDASEVSRHAGSNQNSPEHDGDRAEELEADTEDVYYGRRQRKDRTEQHPAMVLSLSPLSLFGLFPFIS